MTLELIPPEMPAHDVQEEVNRRTCRAGLTTRSGRPRPLRIMSQPASDKYRENYERIFGHK